MLNLSEVKEGSKIEYMGDTLAYGGTYQVVTAESTYKNPADCPESEKGKGMIVEFMNDGTPMFFRVDQLDLKEWRIVEHER